MRRVTTSTSVPGATPPRPDRRAARPRDRGSSRSAKPANQTKTCSPSRTGRLGNVFSLASVTNEPRIEPPLSDSSKDSRRLERHDDREHETAARPALAVERERRLRRAPAATGARCRNRSSSRSPRRCAPSTPGRRRRQPGSARGTPCRGSRGPRRTCPDRRGRGTGRSPSSRPPPASRRARGRRARSARHAAPDGACTDEARRSATSMGETRFGQAASALALWEDPREWKSMRPDG